MYENERDLKGQANPVMVVLAALMAMLVGGALWTAVSVFFDAQVGIVSILIGLMVGYAVGKIGKGQKPSYQLLAGGFALVGCLLGKITSATMMFAEYYNLTVFQFVKVMTMEGWLVLVKSIFQMTDIFFIGLAVYEAHRFAGKYTERPAQGTPSADGLDQDIV